MLLNDRIGVNTRSGQNELDKNLVFTSSFLDTFSNKKVSVKPQLCEADRWAGDSRLSRKPQGRFGVF